MSANCLITVICSTYNRPDALTATLNGLLHQSDSFFEVVIADDGSTQETKTVINNFIKKANFSIFHVWHEDLGFRAAAIRNLALKHAHGDYILFLDGDCIPSPNWIKNHRQLAEKGWSVSGQRILTSREFCHEILVNKNFIENFDWKISSFRTLKIRKKVNRWEPSISFGINYFSFWRKLTPKKWKMMRTCNWGAWRNDLKQVGGFNEKIVGWGHEDTDLAIRMMKAGVKFKSGSFATAVLHLWHKEASRNNAKHNWELATSNLNNKT